MVPDAARPALRTAGHRLRRHVRQVWESRGGGFYGFVAAGSFLYMEATDLAGDAVELAGMGLDLGRLIGFLVNNMVEAVVFVVTAALWPIWWIQRFGIGLGSGALLAVGYLAYVAIRPAVLRWLEDPGPEASGDGRALPGRPD